MKGPFTASALLAIGVLLIGVGARDTTATHGDAMVAEDGVVGSTHWPTALCDTSGSQLVISFPDAVSASYDTTNLPSQKVWWTPRIWWVRNDNGALEHSEWATYGWYWTWARTGDAVGNIVVFPERGYTGGGAYVAWSNVDDQLVYQTTLPVQLYPNVAKKFWLEQIFYWQPNDYQPNYGWDSALSSILDDLLIDEPTCNLP